MKGKIKEVLTTSKGEIVLSLFITNPEQLDGLFDKDLEITLKRNYKKRSLDANAYFWVLCSKLAEATGVSKTEIYQQAIRDIGGNSESYCGQPEAIERLCKEWGRKGLGWLSETFESKVDGCVNVMLYYGSSSYDTKQMSRLIENIVQDCKAVGVETMPPEELKRLIERWDKNS